MIIDKRKIIAKLAAHTLDEHPKRAEWEEKLKLNEKIGFNPVSVRNVLPGNFFIKVDNNITILS